MKKFKIPVTPPTTSKSIRFPNDIIDQVENLIIGKDCTFTAFVVEAVRIALEDIDNEQATKTGADMDADTCNYNSKKPTSEESLKGRFLLCVILI